MRAALLPGRVRRAAAAPAGAPLAAPRRRSTLASVRNVALLAAFVLAVLTLLRAPPGLTGRGDDALSRAVALPVNCEAVRASAAPPKGTSAAAGWAARSALYTAIAADFAANMGAEGAALAGGTQGLSVDALFTWDAATGLPVPKLTRLEIPVRAIVLPLAAGSTAAAALAAAAQEALLPLCGRDGVWFQDSAAFHVSLFHASHHLQPVPATAEQQAVEATAAAEVLNDTCPVRVILERVAVTRGGVFIACWNVLGGAQPAALRATLRAALPRAPETQLVSDAPILHSTLARVLRPPSATALADAAAALSRRLCGMRAVFDAAWLVSEHDALALALRGRYDSMQVPLGCAGDGKEDAAALARTLPPPPRGGRALDAGR